MLSSPRSLSAAGLACMSACAMRHLQGLQGELTSEVPSGALVAARRGPSERADAAPCCAQVGPFWGQGSGQETAKVQMYISAQGARGGGACARMPGPVLPCSYGAILHALLAFWSARAWFAPLCTSPAALRTVNILCTARSRHPLEPCRLRRASSSGHAGSKAYAVPYTVTLKGAGPYTSCSPWEWYATVDGSGQVGPSL